MIKAIKLILTKFKVETKKLESSNKINLLFKRKKVFGKIKKR